MPKGWTGWDVAKARTSIRSRGRVTTCVRCGRSLDLDQELWDVDHLIARAEGGGNEPGNLGPAHRHENRAAGQALAQARRRARRRSATRVRPW